jgi:hypothetical protein
MFLSVCVESVSWLDGYGRQTHCNLRVLSLAAMGDQFPPLAARRLGCCTGKGAATPVASMSNAIADPIVRFINLLSTPDLLQAALHRAAPEIDAEV